MTTAEIAYLKGFVQKCAEANVNPDELAKFAATAGSTAAPAGPVPPAFDEKMRMFFGGKKWSRPPGQKAAINSARGVAKAPSAVDERVPLVAGSQAAKRELSE